MVPSHLKPPGEKITVPLQQASRFYWDLIHFNFNTIIPLIRKYLKRSTFVFKLTGKLPGQHSVTNHGWWLNLLTPLLRSSSSRTASMSWRHAHIRAVVFQNLYRGQRDMYYLMLICTGSLNLRPLNNSSPLSFSAAAAAASLESVRFMPACSHHLTPTRSPGALYDP